MRPASPCCALRRCGTPAGRRVNGRFVFRRNGVERSVILLFRKLFFANSTEKKDRLELVLATRKLLTKEEVLRIAAKAKDTGVDFMTTVRGQP